MLAFIIKLTYNNNRTIPRQLSRQSNRLLTDRSQVRVLLEEPFWPVGQAVKTPPFHGGIPGSIPGRVTTYGRLAQLGERLPYKQDVGSSILSSSTICGNSSAVEHRLAKAGVASSNLVSRSNFIWRHSQAVRQRSAKPLFPSSILGAASTKSLPMPGWRNRQTQRT